MSMLSRWVAPLSVAQFLGEILHVRPYATPGGAVEATPFLDWPILGQILRESPPADVLAVANGRILERPPPRDLHSARALMSAGVSLVVRHAHLRDAGLARLTAHLGKDLSGEIHLQIFVSPGGHSGFGWHYDFEEVLIVQTVGTKNYYFRPNTVDPGAAWGSNPDFTRVRDETTPLGTAFLLPGDWLYMPSRWWHAARCREDSLALSFGVNPSV